MITTFAVGEEGPPDARHGPVTTFALGEEGGGPLNPRPITWTTLRLGEEGPTTDPRLDDPAAAPAGGIGVTTLALGEEGGPGPFGTF